MRERTILFLTGTRADFGKMKSLILAANAESSLNVTVFVTGMHMLSTYGNTVREVEKLGIDSLYTYINQRHSDAMDTILANTISGLGDFVAENRPDMIVIHGDRIEALAGAIVGALNNILVAHIEGGEVSGTIDESIRHSVSKLSHLHFVSNEDAKKRLIQMGEVPGQIYVIGSPDLDLMSCSELPSLESVKDYYDIPFQDYALFMYHPVTTDLHNLMDNFREVIAAIDESGENYIIIYPNNDHGSEVIIEEIDRLKNHPRICVFPSLRFEYFLVLLRHARFMIGNSSAGVREAPFYAVPSVNIGNRQQGRFHHDSILNVDEKKADILKAIKKAPSLQCAASTNFGDGKSTQRFIHVLTSDAPWHVPLQKYFIDM